MNCWCGFVHSLITLLVFITFCNLAKAIPDYGKMSSTTVKKKKDLYYQKFNCGRRFFTSMLNWFKNRKMM